MEHYQKMLGKCPSQKKTATISKFHSYFIHFTVSSCFVFSMLGCLRHLFKKRRPQVTRILKTLRLVRVFRFIMALRTLALWLSFILLKDWIDWWDVPVVFVTHFGKSWLKVASCFFLVCILLVGLFQQVTYSHSITGSQWVTDHVVRSPRSSTLWSLSFGPWHYCCSSSLCLLSCSLDPPFQDDVSMCYTTKRYGASPSCLM